MQNPSTPEWINESLFIHVMKYYTEVKMSALQPYAPTWMNPMWSQKDS